MSLVLSATPSLYFDYRERLNISEIEPLPSPVNHYARTKAEAELLIKQSNISKAIILRPRALFGPWDNTLMPRLLRVIEKGAIPLMRGGQSLLDITYVENVVDAIELALTQPLLRPVSIYNVTNGQSQPLDQLLEQLAEAFSLPLRTRHVPWPLVKSIASIMECWSTLSGGREPLITRYSAGVLAFSQTLDITAIQKELGYQPKVSVEEGLRRHAQWYFRQRKQQQEDFS